MKNSQQQLNDQLQILLTTLQDVESREPDGPDRCCSNITLCRDHLRQLRQSVVEHGFPDQATEIYFFKHIKPAVAGRYSYYKRVFHLHLGEVKGIKQEKERLMRELDGASQSLAQHDPIWRYYRSGSQSLDDQYFLRGNNDWALQPWHAGFDELFSTSADEQLAELVATDLFMEYVEHRLTQQGDPASSPARHGQGTSTRCSASVSDIVELGYALFVAGFFPDLKTIKEVMAFLSTVLRIQLPKFYDVFAHIKERKINITRFLDKIKAALEVHIRTNALC